ncbi:uncharacterized protein LY89DRAFT_718750 [Mollisia scopiformis]|uniref:Uncharacterized protein n=1 Tax=Mollisia scopiformis TaxID=149040 RepID=A0A194XA71_MOLSC|nr:uncharacterized protein LY89DRAFT_718750 [Mollisia scopiformis]KUJ17065.1 hypothetical protein LY89DRAFT_718750 [Mollisia scopiformis]
MDLPPELYGEYSQPSPKYYWNPSEYDSPENFLCCPHARSREGWLDVETLRSLRLTSKAFNQAATSILFRSVRILCRPGLENEVTGFDSMVESLLVPRATFEPSVKSLRIFLRNHHVQRGFLHDTSWNFVDDKNAMIAFIDKMPRVTKNLSQLESLQIFFPTWSSKYSDMDDGTVQLDLDLLSHFRATISTALSATPLSNLTELRLSLPCTHDFVEVSTTVPDSLLARLKALFLSVTDATGPGGRKEYLYWADETTDGDDGFPHSNLQQQYPNTGHMQGIFAIVSRCHNLETLGLQGTQLLDGDLLEWSPASSGLQSLFLERVKFSSSNLIKLFSPNKSLEISKSRLMRIWLEVVDLTADFWEEVFSHLLLCPKLEFVHLDEVSYARGSENFDLKLWFGRPWEDSTELMSTREEDEEAMLAVRDYLVGKAGGSEAYSEKFGERYGLQPDQ